MPRLIAMFTSALPKNVPVRLGADRGRVVLALDLERPRVRDQGGEPRA
jgi:hypothetical protein